jgi:Mrp family chromosome partitioning ATPase
MADQRGGRRQPEGGRTLPIGTRVDVTDRTPRITPDSLDGRTTSPFATPKVTVDEGAARFVDPDRVRTAVNAPGRTVRDVPPRDPRDRILPEQLAAEPAPVVVADVPLPPTAPQREKTKIWVATHRAPVDPDARLILLREPDSQRAASFRVLRHRLQTNGNPRVIAVTSAEAGEGKSTLAANLAMALGECERARVLLVEGNLRSPSLAALFGFLPPNCFALQMSQHKEKPLEPWSVVEAFFPSLHVIAVKPGQESRPLLDGPAFFNAMDMLGNAGYDYIVVDTPPVLGSADVNLVEETCDGVLFAVCSRKSSGRALTRAVEQLTPSKILGITLLDV